MSYDLKRISDLQVKAMLFDMDVDWEILDLVEKNGVLDAVWLRRWKDKKNQSDFDEYLDIDKDEIHE